MSRRFWISLHDFPDKFFGLIFIDVLQTEGGVVEGILFYVLIFVDGLVHFPLEKLNLLE